MFLFHHCFYCTILKNFLVSPYGVGYKNPSRNQNTHSIMEKICEICGKTFARVDSLKRHVEVFTEMVRCSARNVARPSREWITLKDTWKLFIEMMRCSARNVLKNLIAKMLWRGIKKNVVFAVCVVSTSQTPLS